MTGYLLTYAPPCVLAIIAGAIAGAVTALKIRRVEPGVANVYEEPEDDQFIDAEIDLAAVRWAETNNQPPEAAGLMAERLKTLRKIGQQRGWV